MRIIIKPLGMVCIAVVLGGAFAAVALRKPGGVALKTARGNSSSAQNLISLTKWKFYTEKGAVGNMTTLSETVRGASLTGMKIVTDQPGIQAWNVGISNALGVAFKSGEKLQLRFWGRSSSISQITIIMQRNVPGFPDCFKQTIPLTAEWKEYRYEIVTTTMAQWESMIAIHSGFRAGAVELVGAELVHI
ncbi:hypothetical protein [Armatimonas sp.]|uniref:hypothetical protein n=1 Tax=Armatimonas sp. TaxID=1872638 RepID=UPI003752C773